MIPFSVGEPGWVWLPDPQDRHSFPEKQHSCFTKRLFCALIGGNPCKPAPEKAVNSSVTAADRVEIATRGWKMKRTPVLDHSFRVPEVAGNLTRDRYDTRHWSGAAAGSDTCDRFPEEARICTNIEGDSRMGEHPGYLRHPVERTCRDPGLKQNGISDALSGVCPYGPDGPLGLCPPA